MWTAPWQALCDAKLIGDCGHMSGLLMRSRSSLAMMISAYQVSHQLRALEAPVGVRNVLVCGSPGVHHLTSHWPISAPFPAGLSTCSCYAIATIGCVRNNSPVVRIAQAMRASLLARATVTSRAGRRCKSFRVHSATESVLFC